MKRLFILTLLYHIGYFSQSQPRFENDTLYTSTGYKIYTGQTLQFGKSRGAAGFRFVRITNGLPASSLENTSIVVRELSDINLFKGEESVNIKAGISFKDGSKGAISIRIAFEKAIGDQQKAGELIVPQEFRPVSRFGTIYAPELNGDTLLTSCGYKIYKGQLLQFGRATGGRQRFHYVNIKNRVPPGTLQNNQVLVTKLKDFGISVLGNGYITIIGTLFVKSSNRGEIEMHVAFDNAIENIPGLPSELIVPDQYRNRLPVDPKRDIPRLERLYQDGIISFAELQAFRDWLLKQ